MTKKIYKWLGLVSIIPVQGLIFMDQTILPVALPTIQKEFDASNLELQWTVNSYLLFTTMFALLGGKIGDRIGHRLTLFIGLFLFCLFSTFCGISPNIQFLILSRAMQGFAAALMMPTISSLFAFLFPENQRGRALGLSASISSVFMILGPLIGGYLTEQASWRWIFWINWPLCIAGFLLGIFFLPSTSPGKVKIDALGLCSFVFCTGSIVLFFMQGQTWGWGDPKTIAFVIFAVMNATFLFYREKKTAYPILDLALFKRPLYAAINISISIIQFILMVSVFRSIYLQIVLGYTPSQTGVITFISTLPVLFFSPIAGYLSDKINAKLPIILGYALIIYSFFWLGFYSLPSFTNLMVSFVAFGIGVPLIFTPSYSTAMKAVPPQKIGIAFGMVSTLRTLAGTMGVALIGLFIDTVRQSSLKATGDVFDAEVASFSAIHFALAFLLIVALIASMIFHHRKSTHHLPDSPAEGWD